MFNRLFASRKRPCFKQPRQWDTLNLDLSGCEFSITLPPQDYEFPEEKYGKQFNLFQANLYRYSEKPDRNGYPPTFKGVSDSGILKRKWQTYGSIWRSRHLGTLQCSAVVCDISRMETNFDCFNPEQLERLLLHSLYYSRGPGFGLNEHTTPVNWQIKTLHDVDWVYYESWSRKADWEPTNTPFNDESRFTAWLATPLFKDKYLLVSFSSIGSLPAEPSNALMFSRINAIIPSLKLKLSPESTQQKASARQRNPGARYSTQRDPENWRYYGSYRQGDFMAGEDSLVFEGECSPPPKLY
ncbi:hypothetical protein [Marinimicrobium locisalis]|uniref:hypothetical protein n=1 Tax=Marinimicrobium locisalis TaxID=546022 RepID=UPI0032215E34